MHCVSTDSAAVVPVACPITTAGAVWRMAGQETWMP